MKKSKFKIFIFVFIFFSAFFCFSQVKAGDVSLKQGESSVFLDFSVYPDNARCYNTDRLKYFSISFAPSIGYSASLKQVNEGAADFQEFLTCDYTDEYSVNHELQFIFTYNGDSMVHDRKILADMYVNYFDDGNPKFDVVNGSGLHNLKNFRIVESAVIDEKSSNYINVTGCQAGDSSCVINFNKGASLDSVVEASISFKYQSEGTSVGTATVIVKIYPDGVFYVNTGNYGTCESFGNGWERLPVSDGGPTHKYPNSGDTWKKRYVVNEKLSLPKCNADNSRYPLIEFVGWSPDYDRTATLDNYNEPVISANSSFDPSSTLSPIYTAAYKTVNGYYLNLLGGSLKSDADYTKTDEKNGIYVRKVKEDTFVLPTPYKAGAEFVGWEKNSRGRCSMQNDSGCIKGGSTAEADGSTYYAIFSNYKDSSLVNVYESTIVKGNPSKFQIVGTVLKKCESTNTDKVIISPTCVMIGKEITVGEEKVIVRAYDESGNEYINNVRVVAATVTTEADLTTHTFTVNLPNFRDLIGGGSESSSSNATGLTCSTYSVTRNGVSSDFAAAKDGYSSPSGTGESNSIDFRAKSECSDHKVYSALCLDPGRLGPGKYDSNPVQYRIARKLNPSTNSFDKGVASVLTTLTRAGVTSDFSRSGDESWRSAANIAARVMAIHYNESSFAENSLFKASYFAYQELSNKWYKENSLEAWYWIDSNVKGHVSKILSDEKNFEVKDFDDEVKNEPDKGSYENNILSVSGTITLPEGASVKNVDIKCPAFAKCHIDTHALGNLVGYDVTVDLSGASSKDKIDNDCSSENGLCINLNYNPSSNHVPISGAALLEPVGGNALQRLIIFAPGEASATFPLYTKRITTEICKIPECIFEGDCEIDEKYFKQLDCCDYVTDHSTWVYRHYCAPKECLYTDYSLACDISKDGYGKSRDDYKVYEAASMDKDGNLKNNFTCVVDVDRDSSGRTETDKLKDDKGNKYSLEAYKSNKYCRVSCSESWDFSMAGFKDFTGQKAIDVGTYFQINEDVYLSGKRTCVTTYIDYDKYLSDIRNYSTFMRINWNSYSERAQAYYNLENNKHENASKNWNYYASTPVLVTNEGDVCGWEDNGDDWGLSSCSDENDGSSKTECYSYTVNVGTNAEPDWVTRYHAVYYKAKACYKIDKSHAKANQCKIFEISNPDTGYDCYNEQGNLGSCGLNSFVYNTENLGATKEGTPVSSGKESGGYLYFESQPENGSCYTDSDGDNNIDRDKDSYYETLLATVVYKNDSLVLRDSISESAKNVNVHLADIQASAKDFYMCQNFSIVNKNDIRGSSYQNNKNEHDYNKEKYAYTVGSRVAGLKPYTASNYKISNAFAPKMSYGYDEEAFMTIIGDDAVLEYNKDYNSGKVNDDEEPDIEMNSCVSYTTNIESDDGDVESKTKTYEICNNKYEEALYSGKWEHGSEEAANYSQSEESSYNVEEAAFALCSVNNNASYSRNRGDTSSGACTSATFYYYKANYIKQSVTNSGYFSNKDYWYLNAPDVKTHAKSRDDAAKKHPGMGKWYKLGTNHNVFPVGITTRRNIYQYVYFFNNIGVFNDGTLGRVMSESERSLISYNTHACFYEVVENLCVCCGDPIRTVMDNSSNSGVNTESAVTKVAGQTYTYSDRELVSKEGTFAFYPSTVSLNDLDSGTGRKLGTNWSSASAYYYDGNLYATAKGVNLSKAIEELGEKVYDDTPEYSYTLGPSALAELRNNNVEYGINYNNLDSYGVFNIDTNKTNVDKYPALVHYINKSLTGDLGEWITKEYKNDLLTSVKQPMNKDCTVSGSDYTKARSKVRTCRFVDYLDTNANGTYRLAFK